MKLRVFCDFDGTIAVNDVGNEVFTTFGDAAYWWRLVAQWKTGDLDGRDLWRKQCAVSKITVAQLEEFTARQPVDPYFPKFVNYCRAQEIPVYVVSDGMDAYITRILSRHGIDDLDIRANHLIIHDDGSLAVEFPYYQAGCCNCGNCKGAHVRNEKQPGETTIYIGDGHSDICGLREADITFAKGALLEYCREKGISCRTFNDFADIDRAIKNLLAE